MRWLLEKATQGPPRLQSSQYIYKNIYNPLSVLSRGKSPVFTTYLSFFSSEGYFFLTALLTLLFSAGVPNWETRDNAFLACASFSIGYFRLSGSAKDFVGISLRAAVESFAICDLISLAQGRGISSRGNKPISIFQYE